MLNRDQILEATKGIKGLPSFPEVVRKLEAELRSPKASVAGVARIVESDPALATRFLAVANSAFYSRGRQVTAIRNATARLGLAEARRIAVASAMVGAYQSTDLGEPKDFWTHSIAVGLAARVMARMSKAKITEDVLDSAYTVGLVHDLGIAALMEILGPSYNHIVDYVQNKGGETWQVEMGYLKIEHGEVGEVLARRWELPEAVCQAIRFHHMPWACASEHRQLVLLVHLADFVCNNQGLSRGESGFPAAFDAGAWEELGLDLSQVPEIIEGVAKEGERSGAVWGQVA